MRMLLATIILILTTGLLAAQSKSKSMTEDDFDFDKLLAKEESVRRLFGIGFGVGYPLANITISVPYVDIDLGYGGFVGLKPNNFLPYVVMGVDRSLLENPKFLKKIFSGNPNRKEKK